MIEALVVVALASLPMAIFLRLFLILQKKLFLTNLICYLDDLALQAEMLNELNRLPENHYLLLAFIGLDPLAGASSSAKAFFSEAAIEEATGKERSTADAS